LIGYLTSGELEQINQSLYFSVVAGLGRAHYDPVFLEKLIGPLVEAIGQQG
jgi:hypothetical protein